MYILYHWHIVASWILFRKVLGLGLILSTWVEPMGRGWWFLLVEPRSREGETSRAHVILVHVHNNYTDHPPPPDYAPKLDCSTPPPPLLLTQGAQAGLKSL